MMRPRKRTVAGRITLMLALAAGARRRLALAAALAGCGSPAPAPPRRRRRAPRPRPPAPAGRRPPPRPTTHAPAPAPPRRPRLPSWPSSPWWRRPGPWPSRWPTSRSTTSSPTWPTRPKWSSGRTPISCKAYVAGGQGDFVTMPSNNSAIFYNKGSSSSCSISPCGTSPISSPRDATAGSFADIKGQSLAIPFQGSVPDLMFQYIAKSQGLDPQKDFKVRYAADPTQAAQLLLSGQVETPSSARRWRPPPCSRLPTPTKPLHSALAFDEAWVGRVRRPRQPDRRHRRHRLGARQARGHRGLRARIQGGGAVDAGQSRRGRQAGGDPTAPARS